MWGRRRLGHLRLVQETGNFSIGMGVTSIKASSFTVGGIVSTTLNNTGTLTIDTSASSGGSIAFGGTITGANPNAQALTLTANAGGSVTFGAAVGLPTPLGALTITSAKTTANAVNIGGNITASSFTIMTASPVTLTGSSIIDVSSSPGGSILFPSTIDGTLAGAQNLTLTANMAGTVTLTNNVGTTVRLGGLTISGGASGLTLSSAITSIQASSFTVGGTVPTTLQNGSLLTIDTLGGGSIAFGGTITGTSVGAQALTLTANGSGSVTLSGNVGATRLGAFAIGAGTGSLSIGTGVTSIQANSFSTPASAATTLNNSGTLTINTSGNNGTITLAGPVDGAASHTQALTFNPGIGNIVLTGAIGSSVPLGIITITNATNVTANGISAASLTQNAGLGTTTFNGLMSMTSDITLTGNNFTFNAPVLTANNVNIANLGLLTIAAAGDMTLNGSFTQSTGLVQTAGDIATDGQNIAFGGGVTLTGNVVLNTGGILGTITFNGTVDGGQNLQLNAGDIVFAQVVGGNPLNSLQATAAGTIDIYGNQTVSNGPHALHGRCRIAWHFDYINR